MLSKLKAIFQLFYQYLIIFALLFIILILSRFCTLCEPIFPAIEIIVVYYFESKYKYKLWHWFIVYLFIDQLYYFPIGTNPIAFMVAQLVQNRIKTMRMMNIQPSRFFLFSFYALIIFFIRYLIVFTKTGIYISNIDIVFQYFTTIFSYPLLIILLNKLFERTLKKC